MQRVYGGHLLLLDKFILADFLVVLKDCSNVCGEYLLLLNMYKIYNA